MFYTDPFDISSITSFPLAVGYSLSDRTEKITSGSTIPQTPKRHSEILLMSVLGFNRTYCRIKRDTEIIHFAADFMQEYTILYTCFKSCLSYYLRRFF